MALHDNVAPRAAQPGSTASAAPMSALNLLQRILLTTDGTVVRILEAYAGEPVEVVKLDQGVVTTDGQAGLEMPDPEALISRTVLLRGGHTHANLLYAQSLARHDYLDPELRAELLSTDKAIGQLFLDHRVETFREILTSGQEPAGACAPYFDLDPGDAVIFRTYRIVAARRPVVLITEKFPVSAFAS